MSNFEIAALAQFQVILRAVSTVITVRNLLFNLDRGLPGTNLGEGRVRGEGIVGPYSSLMSVLVCTSAFVDVHLCVICKDYIITSVRGLGQPSTMAVVNLLSL